MADQMKQALMDAGLISKKDLERENVKKRHVSRSTKIRKDHIRIICDVCNKSAPDVEQYKHTNKKISGKEWLCIRCADEHCIDDKFRVTNQSTHSKTKLFIRQYGRTKKF